MAWLRKPTRHAPPPASILFAIALADLLLPTVARADCQPASSIREALTTAEVAFVGRVVAAAAEKPGATFSVEEVWVGDLPPTVEVRGMGDAGFMEDDRQWEPGFRYLVIPYVERGVLRDHICTATTEWIDELAVLRPEGARPPEEVPGGSGEPPTEVLIFVGAVVVLVGVSAFAFRRTRDPGG